MAMTPSRRSELRSEAHKLTPVVLIGDKGLTDEVLAEIELWKKCWQSPVPGCEPDPPNPGGGCHGDVHMISHDGLLYDFQACGEFVLVHNGAGGVGSAAIQIARALGARVAATAGGPDKLEI
jgi:hypothetical protein